MTFDQKWRPVCLSLCGALMLTACASLPVEQAPVLETPAQFQTALDLPKPAIEDMAWWEGFSDPLLSQSIQSALSQNIDIDIARANLIRAQALARASKADLSPSIDGFLNAGLSSILTGGFDADADLAGGTSFSFDPDINGRNQGSLEAAQARVQVAIFEEEDVRRLTASAVATQYIAMRRSGASLVLLETSLELQQRTLEIVRARFEAGLSPALDVDRASADLARTQSQRSLILANRREAEYALAVLNGSAPQSGTFGQPDTDIIPDYSSGPALGIPANLLRSRPDIRSAESALIAQLLDVGVEEADLYPSLILPGTLRAARSTGGGLNAITAGLSGILDIPIFDAGRRLAEVDVARAEAQGALASYKSTLLDAMFETETALLDIKALNSQKIELEKAVEASLSAFNQINALYGEGLADFINVLDAQRTLISSREAVLSADANIALSYIELYTAIGWSRDS